ncbi:hypothetical protein JL720_5082 [Aureococcus anophagefferens]|nr:hypothetical protein JL720_5082 [Aureococcus anophagefferens]
MIDVDGSGSLDKAEVVKAVKTDQKVIKFLAKAARKEIEEFTADFVNAARKCFEMIDKDGSGTLTKVEIVKAVSEDPAVVTFLKNCGEENLQFLLVPARLEKALEVFDMMDADQSGSLDKGEVVKAVQTDQKVIKFLVNCGNPNLQYLLVPARLEAALAMIDKDGSGTLTKVEIVKAIAEDADVVKFLQAARGRLVAAARLGARVLDTSNDGELGVFDMIGVDQSGSLDKAEVVKAVQTDDKCIRFLKNCGNETCSTRVPGEAALNQLDTDRDGEISGPEWEEAIESALQFKLEARAIEREEAKKMRKAAKRPPPPRQGRGAGGGRIYDGPRRLEKALEVLDTSKGGEVDAEEWEAVNRGLSKRLEQLENERQRRLRAAKAADQEFSVQFLSMARQVFDMIDVDQSGSLDKAEVVKAVQTDKKVINFLVNCGNPNLQYLLVPARLEAALLVLDTDRDGEINAPEWEDAIEHALSAKLEARAQKRVEQAKAARKEIEEFTHEFQNAARKCCEMIDKDGSGTLTKTEIVKAVSEDESVVKFLRTWRHDRRRGSGSLDKAEVVTAIKTDQKVIKFLVNCGNPNLQYLLVPARLEHAPPCWTRIATARSAARVEGAIETALANKLEARAAQREEQAKAARKEIEEFTGEFLSAARQCFQMIDKDNSGTLTKAEIIKAIAEDKDVVKFLKNCGEENLQFLLRPKRLEKALDVLDTYNDGELDIGEWEDAIHRGLAKRLDELANERERRERAALAEDEAFPTEFLSMARQVFDMMDADQSGALDKAEVVKAVKTDKAVIKFLVNCGNENLQYLLVPARLEAALNQLDTDRDGEISGPEWEEAIGGVGEQARGAGRGEAQAKAARKEMEEFTQDFVNAAIKCFEMIDKGGSAR